METVLTEIAAETPKLLHESEAKAVVKATSMLLKRMLTENVFTVSQNLVGELGLEFAGRLVCFFYSPSIFRLRFTLLLPLLAHNLS